MTAFEAMDGNSAACVYVVDDDSAVRQLLCTRMSMDALRAQGFSSAESFLSHVQASHSGCVVADLYLPEMTGLEMIRELRARGCHMPVILISGSADVPTAVQGMKLGAVDFLQKPMQAAELMACVHRALEADRARRQATAQRDDQDHRLAALSERELEVLTRLVQGESSKMIASHLGISIKTVSHHRARILSKTGSVNTADLVRRAQTVGVCSRPVKAPI